MIYLASPYTDENPAVRQERYRQALLATVHLTYTFRALVYSPIVHSHPIALGIRQIAPEEAIDFNFWRKHDLRMLRTCDELRVLELPNWETSAGVREEIQVARATGILVSYMQPVKSFTVEVPNEIHVLIQD